MTNLRSRHWRASSLSTVTLVTDDLPGSRAFAEHVLGLDLVFDDEESAVFRLGETLVNMLAGEAAPEVFDPVGVPPGDSGARVLLTIEVDDVDDVLAVVVERGATVSSPPVDRPWGVRTASVLDPGGHVWELAAPVAEPPSSS